MPIDNNRLHLSRGSLLIGSIVVVLLVLFLFGWFPRRENTKNIDALAAQNPLPRVEVLTLTPNTKPLELILPSSAQAWHVTPIWARTNGYLIRYLVDIGDAVKQGDLLAEIDTPEIDQELEQALAELANSKALNDIAKITSTRWQSLWNKNQQAVTKQEVDQYNGNLKATEATVVSNEKNVARLTYLQQFKKVYAPFDGTITQRSIDIGSLILGNLNSGPQELFQIAQTDALRFFVQVPQNYFRLIKEGLEAEVSVQEFPDKIFKGTVTRFSKALQPNARTLQTEIVVKNEGKLLYPGVYARAKFILKPDTVNFIIPTTALVIRAGFPHVAVVNDKNIVRMKRVQIGHDYGKFLEIISGLEEGERIITIASTAIADNVEVEIIGSKSPISL
jgi:RND family efflux transporter MFP subunit